MLRELVAQSWANITRHRTRSATLSNRVCQAYCSPSSTAVPSTGLRNATAASNCRAALSVSSSPRSG